MGSDLKNTSFLEFYGLPGCGKSSVSHVVASALRQNGKSISEPTYQIDHISSPAKRKFKKIGSLILYFFSSPKACGTMMRQIRKNGYKGKFVLSHAANLAPKLLAYNRAKNNYVLFDEGLTQSALSLSQNGKLPASENESVLYALCKNRPVKKIYLRVEKKEALRRMNDRASNDSSIEKMQAPEERLAALSLWESSCESLSCDLIIESHDVTESATEVLQNLT